MKRNMQSAAVRFKNGRAVIIDAGEGTQHQVMRHNARFKDKKIRNVTTVLITHLHGDHAFGLPGLLCFLTAAQSEERPLRIVGPRGLRTFLRVSLGLSRTELPRPYCVIELHGGPDDDDVEIAAPHVSENHDHSRDVALAEDDQWRDLGWDDDGVEVAAAPLDHGGIPCVAYALVEKPKLGKIHPAAVHAAAKAAKDDPKRIFAALKTVLDHETTIDLADGTSFPLKDAFVNGNTIVPGRKLVIFGDCRPSRRGPALRLAQKADLVVHEATLENALADQAFERGHSTPADAGRLASSVDAQVLVLWHFSPRYTYDDDHEVLEWSRSFKDQALPSLDPPFSGSVLLANDFDHIPIPPPRV